MRLLSPLVTHIRADLNNHLKPYSVETISAMNISWQPI